MAKSKELIGVVVSDKMAKTVVVQVVSISKHPKYHKVVKHYKKIKAHDEKSTAKVGDSVSITETRPMSKDKRYRVVAVVKKAEIPHVQIKEEEK